MYIYIYTYICIHILLTQKYVHVHNTHTFIIRYTEHSNKKHVVSNTTLKAVVYT